MPFDTTSYILGKKDGQDDIKLTTLNATQNHKTYVAPAGRAYSRVDINAPNVFRTDIDDGGIIKTYNKEPYTAHSGTSDRLGYIAEPECMSEFTLEIPSDKHTITIYFRLQGSAAPSVLWGDGARTETRRLYASYSHTYATAGTYKMFFVFPRSVTAVSPDFLNTCAWFPGGALGNTFFGLTAADGTTKDSNTPEIISMKLSNKIYFNGDGIDSPFIGCSNLESVIWPEEGIVRHDGTDANGTQYIFFGSCPKLKKIELPNLESWLKNNYGAPFVDTANGVKLYIQGDRHPIEYIRIEGDDSQQHVPAIYKSAFQNIGGIKNIILQTCDVYNSAFANMPDLKKVWVRSNTKFRAGSIFNGDDCTLYFEGTAPASDNSTSSWKYGFLGTIVENVTECPF